MTEETKESTVELGSTEEKRVRAIEMAKLREATN